VGRSLRGVKTYYPVALCARFNFGKCRSWTSASADRFAGPQWARALVVWLVRDARSRDRPRLASFWALRKARWAPAGASPHSGKEPAIEVSKWWRSQMSEPTSGPSRRHERAQIASPILNSSVNSKTRFATFSARSPMRSRSLAPLLVLVTVETAQSSLAPRGAEPLETAQSSRLHVLDKPPH
jgi:hypothetical protein